MNELFDGEECGTLAGDADPGDVDLMAEHALPHIGLAALTRRPSPTARRGWIL